MKTIYKSGDKNQRYQGDISIVQITEQQLPMGLSFSKLTKPFVVAEGEVTGHKHTLEQTKPVDWEIAENENGFYLRVHSGTGLLTHQEHEAQEIPQGIFFIGKQWEYDELREWKKVQD